MATETDRHAWEQPGPDKVTAGIHRLPLPLPGDGLKAVNVYAIEQPDGVVLIDSGWALAEARQRLEDGLAELGHDLGNVRRVLVTHIHRDHYELGVQLKKLFGARLALGIGEQPSLDDLVSDIPPERSGMNARLLRAGAEQLVAVLGQLQAHAASQDLVPNIEWLLPDEWLRDQQVIELDGRTLTVIATPGHTQGHVVFADLDDGVLFAGDHVLPHITPSIGFEQVPAESCLADYLSSLALIRELPDLRMLPAHGPVRATTHDRIDELLAHHDDRLDASRDAVAAGAGTAWEVAHVLPWTRRATAFDDLNPFNQMLAVNETAAHLDVLVRRGGLVATTESDDPGAVCTYTVVEA